MTRPSTSPYFRTGNESELARDLVFFRVRFAGHDYESAARADALLADPWAELPSCVS